MHIPAQVKRACLQALRPKHRRKAPIALKILAAGLFLLLEEVVGEVQQELEARSDNKRVVAELLGVPLDSVALGPNLVRNCGFEAWSAGEPEGWFWSNMALGHLRNLALFMGGPDGLLATEHDTVMRVDGFWAQQKPELERARAGYWHDVIELKPDTPYVLSFLYKTQRLREGEAGVWISRRPYNLFAGEQMLPRTDGAWRMVVIVGWNSGREAEAVQPLLRSWGMGNTWFDAVQLRKIVIDPEVTVEDRSTRFQVR